MSGDAASPDHPQASTLQQGAITPTIQNDVSADNTAAFYRPRTAVDPGPRTPSTAHLSPSASGQSAGINVLSEASSASPQLDSPLSPSAGKASSRRLSTADQLKRTHELLKQTPQDLPNSRDRTPRLPQDSDFSQDYHVQVIPPYPDRHIRHGVVVLHQLGGSESSFTTLAWQLHRQQPETSFVLLKGLGAVPKPDSSYHQEDIARQQDELSLSSARILTETIKSSLITKCGFSPRDIVVMGHDQGGTAVLATADLWAGIELGGAVSIGGPLPSYLQSTSGDKVRTPALVLGSTPGDLRHFSFDCIKSRFASVDTCILPDTEHSMESLVEFLAHRLQRAEWSRQAILSFGMFLPLPCQGTLTELGPDGGGIRGYGSLLILQELMNKIGDEEKRLDALEGKGVKTISSFAPWPYKPINPDRSRSSSEVALISDPTSAGNIVASNTENLPNSSLFLPCHYFDYAAGTSTGGLISIMLSRLRMTVDDCIKEYETLGQKIFGNPRPLAFGAILWHKFDYRVLEDVIRKVTERHSEKNELYEDFPSDEDFCRTVVMAYAEYNKTEAPYLFRTYYTPPPSADPKKTKLRQTTARNHGQPPKLRIWQIGRATAAAPKYFPPIKIKQNMGDDRQCDVGFKDGGFGCNNPSKEAYHDVVHKHGDFSRAVGLFVSIGTGVTPLDLFSRTSGNLPNAIANFKAAKKLPSRTLHVHDAMTHLSHYDDKDIFDYYRFDGGKRLGEVELDEWESHRFARLTRRSTEPSCKTLEKMYVATAAYLHKRDVQKDLDECAKLLVKRRRYRTRDASAWDRYASASFYECSYQKCQKSPHKTAQLYKDHVKREHYSALADQPLEAAMKTSRRCWIYRNAPTPPS
ncbi:MAG: hypothetical protein LQ338_002219 [Usnochroma carphineum]|nr:MAG: hypothetical protein LQ338_002219 [Usnochroma carphineum]